MKKRLHLFAVIIFVSTLGFVACSENFETEPVNQEQGVDIFNPQSTDGDEEDSIRGPEGF